MEYSKEELSKLNEKFKAILPVLCSQLFYKHKELLRQKLLYHYTNYNSFINGIVCDNREIGKEVCLWATHWKHLNDPQEINLGYNRFTEIIKEDINYCFTKVLNDSKQISLSKKRDFLPMWSLYGNNGSGIMLSINTAKLLKNYGLLLMPCIYENSEYDHNAMSKLSQLDFGETFKDFSSVEIIYPLTILMSMYISILKDKSYEFEDEVRIIWIDNKYFIDSTKEEYRVADGNKIIPFTKVFFAKDILEEVIVGPNQDAERNCETIKRYLASIGLEHVKVGISKVPYNG